MTNRKIDLACQSELILAATMTMTITTFFCPGEYIFFAFLGASEININIFKEFLPFFVYVFMC